MRRRRSRVPSEEDDTLLDYLRSASNDNPRERRSWSGLGTDSGAGVGLSWDSDVAGMISCLGGGDLGQISGEAMVGVKH